jgi:LysM repeat protein
MMLSFFRKLTFNLLFAGILFLSAPSPSSAALMQEFNDDRPTHTVEAGETLFAISRMYEVGVGELREWNELESDNLRPGMQLYVGPEEQPGSEEAFIYHEVKQGETLFGLSRRYDTDVAQLIEWNELDEASIKVGQQLIVGKGDSNAEEPDDGEPEQDVVAIPAPDDAGRTEQGGPAYALEEDAPVFTYYEVKSGDTLSAIARAFGMPLNQLREVNELDSDMISVGQRLIVGQQEPRSGIAGLEVESTAQGRFYTYEFKQDDDLEKLLQQHQMDTLDFEVLNPGLPPSAVGSGQQLVLLAPPVVAHRNPYVMNTSRSAVSDSETLMRATVYTSRERGRTTTTGELYNPDDLTAAHPSLPLGNVVFVENAANSRGVFVLINDRTSDSRLKLSQKAFEQLQLADSETPEVLVQPRLDL